MMEDKVMLSNPQQQIERPIHYMYLKSFRTEQCQSFLQHKCTAHRPYTCFNWHFLNQRRRRPKKLRDGTFNYSPDVYCTQYDETTGICPTGDNCPYLHRTAGDTERRYHLRYYKTSKCIYETDSKGFCVKNGPHCAFAHGDDDLRQPVFDVREIQALERKEAGIEKIIPEDSLWHDKNFVVNTYKTEPCNKPPKTCRQGYACPYYHSNRDRRRCPANIKYRSIPCPTVKHGDEWGDPTICESGDECQYCHTRTEQQFHPEIYKSCKCNDMYQTGKCPRGPFCAFSHDVTRSQTDTDDDGGTPSSSRMTNSSATSPIGVSSTNVFGAATPLNSVITNSSNRQRQGSTGTPTSVSSGFKGSNLNDFTAGDDGGSDLFDELDKLHMPDQDTSNIGPIGRKVSLEGGRQDSPTTRDDTFHMKGDIFRSAFNSFGSTDSSVLINQGQMGHRHGQPPMLPNLLTSFGSPMPISTNNNVPVKTLESSIVNRSDNEYQLLRDQLSESNSKLKSIQESWAQLKSTCDSYKKEAQEMAQKYRLAEHERERTLTQRDRIQSKLDMIIQSNAGGRNIDENSTMSINLNIEDLKILSINQLRNLQHHLRTEIQKVEIALSQYQRH